MLSEEKAPSAGVHLVLVKPLILPAPAVKCAFLQASELQGESRAQLLEAGGHRLLTAALLFFKNVSMMPAQNAP